MGAVLGALALFVALGGPSYARRVVHLIDGSQIKKGTIQADRLSARARASLKGQKGAKGDTGAKGDKGDQGVPGQSIQGGPGGPGTVIKTRPSGNTLVSSGDGGSGSPAAYPLTGSTWTQDAAETDQFVGKVHYTTPSACDGVGGGNGMIGRVLIDGKFASSFVSSFGTDGPGTINDVTISGAVPEPGASTGRTMTITFWDQCTTAGQNYAIGSVKVSVIGFQ